jgi:hypothetical protein
MNFALGTLSALFSGISIGSGQALQKRSLNRLATTLPTSTSSKSLTKQVNEVTFTKRLKDWQWLLGFTLTYLGELGNWYALVITTLITESSISFNSHTNGNHISNYKLLSCKYLLK